MTYTEPGVSDPNAYLKMLLTESWFNGIRYASLYLHMNQTSVVLNSVALSSSSHKRKPAAINQIRCLESGMSWLAMPTVLSYCSCSPWSSGCTFSESPQDTSPNYHLPPAPTRAPLRTTSSQYQTGSPTSSNWFHPSFWSSVTGTVARPNLSYDLPAASTTMTMNVKESPVQGTRRSFHHRNRWKFKKMQIPQQTWKIT